MRAQPLAKRMLTDESESRRGGREGRGVEGATELLLEQVGEGEERWQSRLDQVDAVVASSSSSPMEERPLNGEGEGSNGASSVAQLETSTAYRQTAGPEPPQKERAPSDCLPLRRPSDGRSSDPEPAVSPPAPALEPILARSLIPQPPRGGGGQQTPFDPDLVSRYFPPLKACVVDQAEFHGLDALEFFAVFFSDGAPYSLVEFHQKRGDTGELWCVFWSQSRLAHACEGIGGQGWALG